MEQEFTKEDMTPPDFDMEQVEKAKQLIMNLVGLPMAIVMYPQKKPDGTEYVLFTLEADLAYTESNMRIYSFLKDLNVTYLHFGQKRVGTGKLQLFPDLVSAMFDFYQFWVHFKAHNPHASDVEALCRQANAAAAKAVVEKIQRENNGGFKVSDNRYKN